MQINSVEQEVKKFPIGLEALQDFVGDQFRLVDNIHSSEKSAVYTAISPIRQGSNRTKAVKFSKNTAGIENEFAVGSKFLDVDEVIDYVSSGKRDGLGHSATDLADFTLEEPKVILSFGERLRLLRDVSFGVFAVHYGGYVHRDIKPSNIFVYRANGRRATIGDFGIASPIDNSGNAYLVDKSHRSVMTPGWGSPEQYNLQEITDKVDSFSMGLTIAKTLFGRNPFNTAIGEDDRYKYKDTTEEFKRILSIIDDTDGFAQHIDPLHLENVTKPLREVISRSLSVDPTVRPDSEEQSYVLEREVQRS